MVLFSVLIVAWAVLSVTAENTPFRWCVIEADEKTKCDAFKAALPEIAQSVNVDINSGCVLGTNDEDCMEKIKNNEADLITLDGGKIFQAGKIYSLVPIVAEDYGGVDKTGYYAVAVAKKATNITFNNTKGKKSCHTGYRKTAGWNIPVGYLLEDKMPNVGCGEHADAQSAAKFFESSCVPGAPKTKGLENLCELCPSGSKCEASSKNSYYGYHGAFHCMADGKGDVAFVKHLTTIEVVAKNHEKYGNTTDYKYLCKDGSTKVVTETSHENCNLGFNPSHAVVTRPGDNVNYIKILLRASMYCQPNTTASNCSDFLIFESNKYASGKKDLLFKDSTKKLVDVGLKNTYKKWLGNAYYKAMEAISKITACNAGQPIAALSAVIVVIIAVLGKVFV